jgi:hypothetical protein
MRVLSALSAVALAFLAQSPARAVDFVRGDVNGDGQVSIADARFLINALAYFGPRPEC